MRVACVLMRFGGFVAFLALLAMVLFTLFAFAFFLFLMFARGRFLVLVLCLLGRRLHSGHIY